MSLAFARSMYPTDESPMLGPATPIGRRTGRVGRPLALAVALAAAAVACGDDGTGNGDAGRDGAAPETTGDAKDAAGLDQAVDLGAEASSGWVKCDPAAQACPGNELCAAGCGDNATPNYYCQSDPGGTKLVGESCQVSADCAKGGMCMTVTSGGSDAGSTLCLAFCSASKPCTGGKTCKSGPVNVTCSGTTKPLTVNVCA